MTTIILKCKSAPYFGAFAAAGTAEVSAEDELVAADAVSGILAAVEELLERPATTLLHRVRHANLVHQPA